MLVRAQQTCAHAAQTRARTLLHPTCPLVHQRPYDQRTALLVYHHPPGQTTAAQSQECRVETRELMRLGATPGLRNVGIMALPLSAVVLGCTAYQAGNILGAAAGASLGFDWSGRGVILGAGGIAFILLATSGIAFLVRALGVVVAAMGAAFVIAAGSLSPSFEELLVGLLAPKSLAVTYMTQ